MEKMNKVKLSTTFRKMAADLYTPVGIYLRLRDKFRDTILLESTDHHTSENSFSFIAINAIGGIEITGAKEVEFKYPGEMPTKRTLENTAVPELVWDYMQGYAVEAGAKEAKFAQGLYGYTAYDAIPFFETIQFRDKPFAVKKGGKLADNLQGDAIPLLRYRLYQYVIAIDHFRDELYLLENHIPGIEGDKYLIENIICGRDLPQFPFECSGNRMNNGLPVGNDELAFR